MIEGVIEVEVLGVEMVVVAVQVLEVIEVVEIEVQ
jgi:hypothetical protein